MAFALISTIDVEQPYRFCEVSEAPFLVTEPALFWVPCPEGVTPETHKWDGAQFVALPAEAVELQNEQQPSAGS
jgi:hypothetical protein